MTLIMIDIVCRGVVESPERVPERMEVINFLTSHLTIYNKKEKYTGLFVWILLAKLLTLVFLSKTSKFSGNLPGASMDPLKAISIIFKVISSHFEPGNPGNPVGQANILTYFVRLTYWVPWVPRFKMARYDPHDDLYDL